MVRTSLGVFKKLLKDLCVHSPDFQYSKKRMKLKRNKKESDSNEIKDEREPNIRFAMWFIVRIMGWEMIWIVLGMIGWAALGSIPVSIRMLNFIRKLNTYYIAW